LTRNERGNLRAGEGVGCICVEHVWIKNSRIVIGINTRELDKIAGIRDAIPVAPNPNLCTTGIKLCSVKGRGEVESDNFVADKVVAWGEVVGDGDRRDASVEEVVLDPIGTVGFSADLVDLEPLRI